MTKRLFAVFLGAALTVVMLAAPSYAHTATGGADCDSFTLVAESYDAGSANTYSWTFGDKSDSGTFGSDLQVSVATPQKGETTAWSYVVEAEDGSFHFEDSGTVGPCGEVPPDDENRHVKTRVKVIDECNCYRDHVKMLGGKHVTIKKYHPKNTVWRFKVTGDVIKRSDGSTLTYKLPSRINGNRGWAQVQWYTVKTKNQICPCVKRGDCQQVHPNFTPPPNHCRGRCK